MNYEQRIRILTAISIIGAGFCVIMLILSVLFLDNGFLNFFWFASTFAFIFIPLLFPWRVAYRQLKRVGYDLRRLFTKSPQQRWKDSKKREIRNEVRKVKDLPLEKQLLVLLVVVGYHYERQRLMIRRLRSALECELKSLKDFEEPSVLQAFINGSKAGIARALELLEAGVKGK